MFPGPYYGFLIRVILPGWSDGRPQRPDLTGRRCALFEESGLCGAPVLPAVRPAGPVWRTPRPDVVESKL
jgi:hypothetical protein